MLTIHLHFHSLDLDPPGVRGLVQRDLHVVGNALPLGQNVAQVLRTQHVPVQYMINRECLAGLDWPQRGSIG